MSPTLPVISGREAVKALCKAGFVERRSDPRDERVSRVYLTDRGRAIRSEVEAVWTALEAETFAGVAEGDRDRLGAILLHVRQNLIGVTSRCGDR